MAASKSPRHYNLILVEEIEFNMDALLTPLSFGNWTLRNRVMMGSMHMGFEESKSGLKALASFYEERAKGGVALIVTGGFAPNLEGGVKPLAGNTKYLFPLKEHRTITTTVHQHDTKILLQLLHAGRYAYHPFLVAPSKIKSPISPFTPRAMSESQIEKTIDDFVYGAKHANDAGYDGVEIMGSEGYLINQFLSPATNHRKDKWGFENDGGQLFARSIVERIRAALPANFILMFRLSLTDLIQPEGSSLEQRLKFAQDLEKLGINIMNSGIGWHEARVPTIATCVPPGFYTPLTAELKKALKIPVVAVNRINTPELANSIIEKNIADLVSLARPLLADSHFVVKVMQNRSEHINTCIGCNQSCLDRTFKNQQASCLVNPRAGMEQIFPYSVLSHKVTGNEIKKILVVGAGPAGLMAALTLSKRGHHVTLAEKSHEIGGQFLMAMKIPGKSDFAHTIRYYQQQLIRYEVELLLNTTVSTFFIQSRGFDEVVIATGLRPRDIQIPGMKELENTGKVYTYKQLLTQNVPVAGKSWAIIGAGGIGFDVATYLVKSNFPNSTFFEEWGVDEKFQTLKKSSTLPAEPTPLIYLCQRKKGKLGEKLGKTTGWIHRSFLKNHQVRMLDGVNYERITNEGLFINSGNGEELLKVDGVVICAGLESVKELPLALKAAKISHHVIGGAHQSMESDAQMAFRDGFEIGMKL